MEETSSNVFNIGRRVQLRRNFTRLLKSISSTPKVVVVIPDDETQQSEGDQGAIKHPIVYVQPMSQSSSGLCPPGGPGGVELHQTPPRGGVPGGDLGSNVFLLRVCRMIFFFYQCCRIFLPCISTCCRRRYRGQGQPKPCFIWSLVPIVSNCLTRWKPPIRVVVLGRSN